MTLFTTRTSAFRNAVPLYQIALSEEDPAPYSRLVVKSLAQSMELPADRVSMLLEDYLTADSGEGLPPLPEFLAGDLPLLAEGETSFLSDVYEDLPDWSELAAAYAAETTENNTAPEDVAEPEITATEAPAADTPTDTPPAGTTGAESEPGKADDRESAAEPSGETAADTDAAEEVPESPPAAEDAEIIGDAGEIIEIDAGEVEKVETCLVETAEEIIAGEALPAVTDPWPWETTPDMTLEEALAALNDKELAHLTEEIVRNTIEEKLPEGAIKSLCHHYSLEYQKIYSAIQRESRRRISRMNSKPRTSPQSPDPTMELAMRMAKKFLLQDMQGKRTWFKSPLPNEDGNYYIFQSHKVDDEELPIDFPTERVYYREVGDGWAISVGY